MSKERYIHISNWDGFQHRDTTRNKKTAAPWIKDSPAQLNDEDYLQLTFAQRGLLQDLRRQYALNRGRGIRADAASIQRLLGQRVFNVQLERLNRAGFIEFSASKLPASCQQDASLDVDVDVDKEKVLFAAPEKPSEKPAEKKKPGSVSPIRKPRKVDPLWDAMVAAFDAGEFTDSSRGVMNRAVSELRKVNATPQQVGDRKRAYEKKFPDIACTPPALVKHWPYLNGARPAPTTAAERYRLEDERREAH